MRNTRSFVGAAMVLGVICFGVADVSAQVIGSFRWRYEPFCNVVTLTVIQQGPTFTGIGTDDDCGFTSGSPATATFFVTGGTVRGNITTVGFDGVATNSRIELSLASIAGNWSDNFGNSGNFIFNPASAPGSPRPVAKEAWAFVTSNGGLHATSGNLAVTHPATGVYCVVVPKRASHKAAQVSQAGAGGTSIVSVGTGNTSVCDPLSNDANDVIPVYVRTTAGVAADGNFTIVVPAQ